MGPNRIGRGQCRPGHQRCHLLLPGILETRRGVEGIAGGPGWVPLIAQALILFGVLLVAWPQRSRQRLHSKQPARPRRGWLRAALAVSLIILAVVTSFGGSLLSDTAVALWPVSFTLGPILLAAGIIIAAGPQQHTTEPQAATARQQAQRAKANLHPAYWIGLPAVAGSIAGVILGHLLPSLDLLTPVIGTIFGATAGTAVYTARQQSPTHTTSDRQPERD